ncbi:MAG: hypothetical protein PHQ43_10350, partial [Dehalococcoidales bacterium]|nr:hypothetical protein [Dehalococcoidales bacterium]
MLTKNSSGTGAIVRTTGAKLTTPDIGAATATSITTAALSVTALSNGKIPYHVSDASGLADGPSKTDVDDAVTKKHAAVTIDGTSPLSLSTQAISLKNNAGSPAAVTAIDTDGTLAGNADTALATQKATKTYADLKLAKASNLSDVSSAATAFTNIKQSASTSATGVVELATVAEAVAGTDTSRAVTADGVAASAAVVSSNKGFAQAVNMTYAASGSSGIFIGDDADLDFGTEDFTLVWRGSLPDYTPSTDAVLMQKTDGTNGWLLQVDTTGVLQLLLNAEAARSSTVAPTVLDGTAHEFACVVTRETAAVAGSVVFYTDGLPLGASVAITAGAPTTVNNAVSLYVMGTSAARTDGACSFTAAFNRRLTAAEVLDLYRNGVKYADKWGSQTPVYTSDFSAGADSWNVASGATRTGNTDSINGSDNWLKVERTSGTGPAHISRSTITAYKSTSCMVTIYNDAGSSIEYFMFSIGGGNTYASSPFAVAAGAEVTSPLLPIVNGSQSASIYIMPCNAAGITVKVAEGVKWYIKNINVYQTGAVLALEPEGIESSAWKDSSDNALDATYPAAGSSFVRRTNTLSYTASAPLDMDAGNMSLVNDAAATITEVDTGVLANSDTVIPTSKAVLTAMAAASTHAQQHSITATADHTSTASEGYVLIGDANGLPVSGTNTDDEIAAAVTATHTQDTDTDLGTLGTKNPPIDADKAIYRDSTASDALVTSTWTQVKAFLKTYFDTVYLTGDVFYGSNYASLADALTAAEGGTLIIDSDFTTGTDEIPSTVSVEVKYGAVITVSTGATLTISGPFKAGPYQVFSCTGTGKVVFGAGAVTEVYAEWWGAVANDATDDYAAVQAAINAITDQEYTSGILRLLAGIYRISATLIVKRGCTITGSGRGRPHDATYEGTGTVLLCTANTTLLKVDQTVLSLNAYQNHFFRLSNLRLDISTTATSGAYGFDAGTTNGIMSVVTEVNIGAFYIGMYTNGARIWATHMFINNTVNDGVCYVTSDQIYLHAVIVVAAGNNGITCSGLYARVIECETFGCEGWGAKIHDGEIIGGYFNNDRLGEIYVYHASEYGLALNITGAVIQYAGKDPDGWFTTNTTAPAIKVETYSSNVGPVNISNVWIDE